ncbi:hypothetical protein SC1083_0049 [Aggregatibacter actinomycetemcomitans serotype e str. SC1083]|uniref:Uncharacterized protein n=1 Tax=Aggregatibacter actinomycetemcomitans serotype e str. SC1083 TaxID=907488 RepID=G4A5G4_AGGAC|nr:hypothetical protein SC1083_0049 [Aggregatibacter actinomycetemcomitans serotype e str. SC1083]
MNLYPRRSSTIANGKTIPWRGHSTTLLKTGDVAITFVPTRLSGRTLGADNSTLWGGHSKKRFLK